MFDSLIKAIQGDVEPRKIQGDDGQTYFSRQVFLTPEDPEAEPINISTLTGIVDYFRSKVDEQVGDLHIRVVSPTQVVIEDELDGFHRQRETLVVSDCSSFIGKGYPFGQWLDLESFIIAVQAHFVEAEMSKQILALVGNIVDESIRESSDDGVSQEVSTRQGIRHKAMNKVPNPVALKPYRTFTEVEQPEGSFVLRLRKAEREGIKAALFEAGGGKWKCDAVQEIAQYLREKLPEVSILA